MPLGMCCNIPPPPHRRFELFIFMNSYTFFLNNDFPADWRKYDWDLYFQISRIHERVRHVQNNPNIKRLEKRYGFALPIPLLCALT